MLLSSCLSNAGAASFECAKATTLHEKAVCSSSTLSELDENLASAYKIARTTSQNPEKLKNEQLEWLNQIRTGVY